MKHLVVKKYLHTGGFDTPLERRQIFLSSMPVPKVLLIRRRYLGDIALLGAVFRNIRLHWPDAHLALLSEVNYAAVGRLNPDIDSILTFPTSLFQWPGFIRRLRREKFTHVIDFDHNDRTAFTTRLTGAPVRITHEHEGQPPVRPWTYTQKIPLSSAFYDTHSIVDSYLTLLKGLSITVVTHDTKLVPTTEDFSWARKIVGPKAAGGRPATARLLIHPGSRSPFRIWPADRFSEICDRVQDDLNAQVFIVAGPSERALVHKIRSQTRSHVVALEEPMSIGQFAALASECGLMLCHDSGPMHVASASGAKIIALYGSQNAAIWRPLGEGHTILQTTLPCTCLPDLPLPCQKADSYRSYCVRKISVEDVYRVLKPLLLAQS